MAVDFHTTASVAGKRLFQGQNKPSAEPVVLIYIM